MSRLSASTGRRAAGIVTVLAVVAAIPPLSGMPYTTTTIVVAAAIVGLAIAPWLLAARLAGTLGTWTAVAATAVVAAVLAAFAALAADPCPGPLRGTCGALVADAAGTALLAVAVLAGLPRVLLASARSACSTARQLRQRATRHR